MEQQILPEGDSMRFQSLTTLLIALWMGAALLPVQSSAAILTTLQDGTSMARAIPINAPNEKAGVAAEYHWIGEHFPGYKRGGQALLNGNGRYYDAIEIVTTSGEHRKIYFDITSFFGKM
jgi:hypothetical protein